MLQKPLFIVDMTLYEFLYILDLLEDVMKIYPENERKQQLKKRISNMFGKIPLDKNKPPRSLAGSKKKITSNFMITINQLGFLDNPEEFEGLYILYKNNKAAFFTKLRKIVLIKGRWQEYINAMRIINQRGNFKTKTQYMEQVAAEIQTLYPNISIEGHKKQLGYTLRWMMDGDLNLIIKFSKEYGMEINEEFMNP